MKFKGALCAVSILIIYCWLIWPKNIDGPSIPITTPKENFEVTKPSPIKPDLKSAREIVKTVTHQKEKQPFIERKDPGVILDHKHKNAQEVIEGKGYGKFPAVDMKNMNEHKQFMLNALQNPKENSGAVSIVGKREKFDLERYLEDPTYYLNTVEPGRAFDSAKANSEIKNIERVGYSSIQTTQNKTVELKAKGEKGMPVSFTVFDGGHFQNGLSFITIKAGEGGVATAEYTPTNGVVNQTRIRAASPVNSGTLQWTVFVHLENQEAKN